MVRGFGEDCFLASLENNYLSILNKNPPRKVDLFLKNGASEGNRTLTVSLEGWSSTIKLHSQVPTSNCFDVDGLCYSGTRGRTWTGTDQCPMDFKSIVSTYSTTRASLVRCIGFEPMTHWLKASCSTCWANSA